MGVVGSLPSPPSTNQITENSLAPNNILSEQSSPSNNESTIEVMPPITAVMSTNISNSSDSTTNNNVEKKSCTKKKKQDDLSLRSTTVEYGPIQVRKRRYTAPTLSTGRQSKFIPLEGSAAIQRSLRREKNREAARRLKEKRTEIEKQLEQQIIELESKENELLSHIDNLEMYKQYLENQCQQIIRTRIAYTIASTKCNHRRTQKHLQRIYHYNNVATKKERRSPSPPRWELFFSI